MMEIIFLLIDKITIGNAVIAILTVDKIAVVHALIFIVTTEPFTAHVLTLI